MDVASIKCSSNNTAGFTLRTTVEAFLLEKRDERNDKIMTEYSFPKAYKVN